MSIKIRAMLKEDLPAVIRIQETIIQRPVSSVWKEHLQAEMNRPASYCLVAVSEGLVVGFVVGEVKIGAFGAEKTGWLGYVGVTPKKMGQGVGRTLARALFEAFKKDGVEDVYTAVRWDSADMLSFFKSLGFDRSNFINLHKRPV